MNKRTALEQKAKILQSEIANWIRKNKLFGPGDTVVLKLELVSTPCVQTRILRPRPAETNSGISFSTRYFDYLERPLTNKDWETILALDLPVSQRKSLEVLCASGNKGLEWKAIEEKTGYRFGARDITRSLYNSGLGFRVDHDRRDPSSSPRPRRYRVYAVEKKSD